MDTKINQDVVEYLEQNKEQYTKESLIAQLKKSGYSSEEIEASVNTVYVQEENNQVPSAPTTDDEAISKRQKRIDIFIGIGISIFLLSINIFLLAILTFVDYRLIYSITNIVKGIIVVLGIWYLIKKKKGFIVIGIVIGMIMIPLLFFGLLFGSCIAVMGLHGFRFAG